MALPVSIVCCFWHAIFRFLTEVQCMKKYLHSLYVKLTTRLKCNFISNTSIYDCSKRPNQLRVQWPTYTFDQRPLHHWCIAVGRCFDLQKNKTVKQILRQYLFLWENSICYPVITVWANKWHQHFSLSFLVSNVITSLYLYQEVIWQ